MAHPPKVLDQVVTDEQAPQVLAQGGFLTLVRRRARNRFTDGSQGPWYDVETVLPRFNDAVVLLLFSLEASGETLVALRRSARPSLCLRRGHPLWQQLDHGQAWDSGFWELPAGGVEPEDLLPGAWGLIGRASQEAWEEAGLRVGGQDFFPLGPSPLQAPALCPERLHYLAAPVTPALAQAPLGDGHPMEEGAQVVFIGLDEALGWCQDGRILDTKTEVGLHRLAQWRSGGLSAGNERKKP